MRFLSFVNLYGARFFLALIPLVILYFLKLRRPRVAVPSLVLWASVLNDQRVNSPFQRFRRNLLLLLQVLLQLGYCWIRFRKRSFSPVSVSVCVSPVSVSVCVSVCV